MDVIQSVGPPSYLYILYPVYRLPWYHGFSGACMHCAVGVRHGVCAGRALLDPSNIIVLVGAPLRADQHLERAATCTSRPHRSSKNCRAATARCWTAPEVLAKQRVMHRCVAEPEA